MLIVSAGVKAEGIENKLYSAQRDLAESHYNKKIVQCFSLQERVDTRLCGIDDRF